MKTKWTCSKCGQETEYKPRRYQDGSSLFIHKAHVVTLLGTEFNHVDESCSIPKGAK